ncbi:MAG TPA: hypothetical protein IAC04_01915 [Candidatus Coprenecus stercoravium]|uniref:Uncharacterized protein n=1 Tax=Candidatus Coprenecus stercoravium TaxID=2840735 RepID=A0A9D2GPJ8_9BACT|nr:hypothetical protein [Candidatus Coprenecus stercoravium]
MSVAPIYRTAQALLISVLLLSCRGGDVEETLPFIVDKALNDSTSVYYNDFSGYPELSSLPIGIFDCSVNGFEVVERFLTLDRFDNITGRERPDGIADFGGENIQFLSDRANAPYGGYVAAGNLDFLQEIILGNTLFMMDDNFYNLAVDEYRSGFKSPVKLIVVSSPVADLHGLSAVNEFLALTGTGVKAVGVMESGIREAVSGVDGNGDLCVGVLFPPGGVSSIEYETAIRKAASGIVTGDVQVLGQEAVGLDRALRGDTLYVDTSATAVRDSYRGPVTGISYNNIDLSLFDRYGFDTSGNALLYSVPGSNAGVQLNSVENYVRYHLVSMIERHRRSGSRIPVSSIILADAGYHQLMPILQKVMDELYNYRRGSIYLYRTGISPDFKFIDPSECAAMEAYRTLREDGHLALSGDRTRLMPFISLPSGSVPPEDINADGGLKDSYKYSRKCGSDTLSTKIVPFAPRYVDPEMMNYIEKNNPYTYLLIRNSLY